MGKTIGILFNPISGRGQAERVAESIGRLLTGEQVSEQFNVRLRRTPDPKFAAEESSLSNWCRECDALLIAGGDGTVLSQLRLLQRTALPFALLPCGNESLFAKAFQMSLEPAEVLARLQRFSPQPHRVARICSTLDGSASSSNGPAFNALFFTMASVGLDAEVVHDLHVSRVGPIGHRGYILPTLRRFFRFRPPVLSIVVDGTPVVTKEAGYLVIANTPEYARGLNPITEASSTSGWLSARFYPGAGRRFYLRALALAALRRPLPPEGSRLIQGEEFRVEAESHTLAQVDGEPAGSVPLIVTREASPVLILE